MGILKPLNIPKRGKVIEEGVVVSFPKANGGHVKSILTKTIGRSLFLGFSS